MVLKQKKKFGMKIKTQSITYEEVHFRVLKIISSQSNYDLIHKVLFYIFYFIDKDYNNILTNITKLLQNYDMNNLFCYWGSKELPLILKESVYVFLCNLKDYIENYFNIKTELNQFCKTVFIECITKENKEQISYEKYKYFHLTKLLLTFNEKFQIFSKLIYIYDNICKDNVREYLFENEKHLNFTIFINLIHKKEEYVEKLAYNIYKFIFDNLTTKQLEKIKKFSELVRDNFAIVENISNILNKHPQFFKREIKNILLQYNSEFLCNQSIFNKKFKKICMVVSYKNKNKYLKKIVYNCKKLNIDIIRLYNYIKILTWKTK